MKRGGRKEEERGEEGGEEGGEGGMREREE